MDPDATNGRSDGALWHLIAIGAIAGMFASLFGVGGGIVMVPLLVILLGFDAKIATATSLAAIIVTATAGVVSHAALGNVAWGHAVLIGVPAVAGLLGGLWIKERLSVRNLTLAFAVLLLVVAAWLVLQPADGTPEALGIGTGILVACLGVIAGALAGLFGVGGGILFVPALVLILGVPQLRAEGASLLAIIPVSLVGSWRQHRAGTVRWRPAGIMGLSSIATAVAFAFVADATPADTLKVLFALLMAVTAVQLGMRALRQPASG